MYEYTDKVIHYLNQRFITIFDRARGLTSFDELNILQFSKSMYAELEQIVLEALLMLAQQVYRDNGGIEVSTISRGWLTEILESYDPVTKYVYLHEVERKCARFAESLIASDSKGTEIDSALRYWSFMAAQYCITVTDEAVKQAYLDYDVKWVRWVTVKDEKRCNECRSRHNKVYPIGNIPPKPHIGCRCYTVPWTEGDER